MPTMGWQSVPEMLDTNWPRADISETDEKIVITAELPGVDRNDIDIALSDDR